MNDKSNIQPRAKIMWYFEPRIERKKSRYHSTFLVRLLGSKYFIILALVGYLLCKCYCRTCSITLVGSFKETTSPCSIVATCLVYVFI